jgi:hypothetical protein
MRLKTYHHPMRLSVVTLIGLGLLGVGGALGASLYLFNPFALPQPIFGLGFLLYLMLTLAFVYGGFELMIVGAVLTIVGSLSDLTKWRDQQSRA